MSDNQRGAIYMMAAMLAFMVNDAFSRSLAGQIPALQILALRSVLAGALILPYILRQGVPLWGFPRRDVLFLAGRCLADSGSSFCVISALFLITLADATAILMTVPLTVTLCGALFLGAPVGWRRLVAILLGFVGVLIVLRPDADGVNAGAWLAVAGVGFVTLRELLTRSLSPAVPSLAATFYTLVSGAIVGGTLMTLQGWQPMSATVCLRMVLIGVFALTGYVFSVLAMRTGELAVVAPFRYMALPFALVMGVLVFSEFPDLLKLLGCAIIAGTGLFTLWRERQQGAAARAAAPGQSKAEGPGQGGGRG